ncbi:MAG: DDE-type integrase/transposase/recombinase [Rhodocyclaceae bacterium]|nr:DDE-type integrase/transposase/recombinase [Rhodocyclaceae bacterium]
MKTHYSCAELAAFRLAGFPETKKGWYALVERDGWSFVEVKGLGGKSGMRRDYSPPPAVLKEIREQERITAAVESPNKATAILRTMAAAIAQIHADDEADQASRQQRGEANLKALAGGLSGREAITFQGHCEIVDGWRVWFKRQQPLRKSSSWLPYSNAYNREEIPVTKAVREAFPEVSPRSVQRWVLSHEKGDFAALIDHRNGAAKRGQDAFSLRPLLAQAAIKLMLDRPGIKTVQLHDLLCTAAIDASTGEILFDKPSYDQTYRFQKAWIENNVDLYLQATNPDAWKNQCMLAFGSYSDDVTELNGRWEMDATPADWLLLDDDGKKRRYTVSVIIDVWSRRIMVVVARTPKTQTHCFALRLALLAWGVPREIVTDNGQDYVSNHFVRVLEALGIQHTRTNPFSPEEKPHVERVIGTLNHSILELLPNFAGHSVADRKALEARSSFADRLMKRGEPVDFGPVADITGEQMQAQINTWIAGIYEQRQHGTLGVSPFAKAASWKGEVRRIQDERALDILLAPASDGGTRTLQKKGIKIDGAWFIAPELGDVDMGSTLDVYETDDLGAVVVYYRKNFLCIAVAAARLGVDRKGIAAHADARQKLRIKEAKARVRQESKGKISTDALLAQHLTEKAIAAGKLIAAPFGKANTAHTSKGLTEAARAGLAMEGPKPSAQAAQLQAEAKALMAQAPTNVAALPARAHATPLEGMTDADKYALWLDYDALVKAHGGMVDLALPEAWQQRWYPGFPTTSIFRSQQSLAESKSATGHAGA